MFKIKYLLVVLYIFISIKSFASIKKNQVNSNLEDKLLKRPHINLIDEIPKQDKYLDIININTKNKNIHKNILSSKKPSFQISNSDVENNLKEMFTGFSLMNGNKNKEINFRGMSGSRIATIVNGSEIQSACASRMDNISNYVNLNNVDTISLVKGPQTLLYGSGSYAGILNLEQKTPKIYFPMSNMNYNLFADSQGKMENNLEIIMGNKIGYIRYTGGAYLKIDHSKLQYFSYDKWNKYYNSLTLGFTPLINHKLEVKYDLNYGDTILNNLNIENLKNKRQSISLQTKHYLNSIIKKLEFNAWHHNLNHTMQEGKKNNNLNKVYKIYNNTSRMLYGLRIIGNIEPYHKISLKSGIDFNANKHFKTSNENILQDICFNNHGIFTEILWKKNKYNIIGGSRLEYVKAFNDKENRAEKYISSFIRIEQKYSKFPFIHYIGLGINNRFPDYWELASPKLKNNLYESNFKKLKRERILQLDLGIYKKFHNFEFFLTSFINKTKDFIIFQHSRSSNNCYAQNINAITRGGELDIYYRINNNLNIADRFSFYLGDNKSENCPLPRIPPFENNIILNCKNKKIDVNAIFRLVFPQKRISPFKGDLLEKDLKISEGFALFSVNMIYNITAKHKLIFGIDNIFNKKYQEHLDINKNNSINIHQNDNKVLTWLRVISSF